MTRPVSRLNTQVVVTFDRKIQAIDIDTCYKGFSLTWLGQNRWCQPKHKVVIPFSGAKLLNDTSILLYTNYTRENDYSSFRNADVSSATIEYVADYGGLYGNTIDEPVDSFTIPVSLTDLDMFKDIQPIETFNADVKNQTVRLPDYIGILSDKHAGPVTEAMSAVITNNNVPAITILTLLSEIKP